MSTIGPIASNLYEEASQSGFPYDERTRAVIDRTVDQLSASTTSGERPGILLGKIQSGKTKTFLGVIALAADNGFSLFIVLTKGTKALTSQTYERLKQAFETTIDLDELRVFDIMTLPKLTLREQRLPMIVVVKKERRNLERLKKLFEIYPGFTERKSLLIDDEADFASIGFKRSKTDEVELQAIMGLIDEVRAHLPDAAYLQVTATPYSLYLQPTTIPVISGEVQPTRPAFTELVPVHDKYVGGEEYFEKSKIEGSVASFFYEPVPLAELDILHHADRRRFKPEDALTNKGVAVLRRAIVNFVVGGLIRRLQCREKGERPKKYSFIIHTESRRGAHAWQEEVVEALIEALRKGALEDSAAFKAIVREAYDDLSRSVAAAKLYLPPFNVLLEDVEEYLPAIQVEKVNSEKDIMQLLDRDGQLHLRNRLNIFIGGQILDRGLTIGNLIGFYYGRRSQKTQQDTVLQHHRMYGARPPEDLAVTRFYTSREIYEVLAKVHDFDSALRKAIEDGTQDNAVVFIQKDKKGSIVPCSPNKILVSTITTLKPRKRLLPVGFQTGYKTNIEKIIREIDSKVSNLTESFEPDEPVLVSVGDARELVELVAQTFIVPEDSQFSWDYQSYIAAMEYVSRASNTSASKGNVWLLVKRDRQNRRQREEGRFFDAPDTSHVEGEIARKFALDLPMLMMFRQKGDKELGWRNCPFWWPVLYMPENMKTVVFSRDIDQFDDEA